MRVSSLETTAGTLAATGNVDSFAVLGREGFPEVRKITVPSAASFGALAQQLALGTQVSDPAACRRVVYCKPRALAALASCLALTRARHHG